jgi:hypothetical protein
MVIAGVIVAAAACGVAWLAWPAPGTAPDGVLDGLTGLPRPAAPPPHGAPHPAIAPQRAPEAGAPHGSTRPKRAAGIAGDEPPASEGYRFLRVIDDATGEPALEARVIEYTLEEFGDIDWDEIIEGGEAVDRWGRYPVAVDEDAAYRYLVVGAGGRCAPLAHMPPGDVDVTVRLRPGNVITGTARNVAGDAPLADADVVLGVGTGGATSFTPVVRTDANGRYRFAGLPPGVVFVPMMRHAEQFAGPDVTDHFELWGWDASDEKTESEESLPSMLQRGRAKRFDGTNATHTIDLIAGVREGRWVHFTLRLPSHVQDQFAVGWHWDGPGTHSKEGIATVEHDIARLNLFLGVGAHALRFRANGARLALTLHVAGSGPRLHRDETLQPARPLVVQFVDAEGAPLRRAGIRLSTALAGMGSPAPPRIASGPIETEHSKRASDAEGRLAIDPPLDPWGAEPAGRMNWFLAASGEELVRLQQQVGPAHVRVDFGALRRRLLQPGSDPVVVTVPARAWAPLRLRVVSDTGRPLGGVRLRLSGTEATTTPQVTTDSAGYAEVRLTALPRSAGFASNSGERTSLPAVVHLDANDLVGRQSLAMSVRVAGVNWRTAADPKQPFDRRYPPQEPGVATVLARPARWITLRLHDADGKPLRNTEVWTKLDVSYLEGSTLLAATTSAEGEIELAIPASAGQVGLGVRWAGAQAGTALVIPAGATSATVNMGARPVFIKHH